MVAGDIGALGGGEGQMRDSSSDWRLPDEPVGSDEEDEEVDGYRDLGDRLRLGESRPLLSLVGVWAIAVMVRPRDAAAAANAAGLM